MHFPLSYKYIELRVMKVVLIRVIIKKSDQYCIEK